MSLETTTGDQSAIPLPTDALPPDAAPPIRQRGAALRAWLSQPVNLFLLLAALLPIVFIVSFITDRGVNMPILDDWDNAAVIAIKTADGTLTLPDLFRQYVSHRMFFTNLYTAITTALAQWPIKATLYFIVVQAVLCLVMLAALFYKDQPRALPVVLVAFSVLMFSVRQNINWLLSTQTSWFFVLLFFLAATVVLRFSRPGWRPVLIAGMLVVCGVFSTLHGFAAFPVLLVYMLMLGYRKPGYSIFWVILGVLVAIAFLSGYDSARGAPQYEILLAEPYRVPLYLFTYLGNPFVIIEDHLWPLAATIGAVGLVLGAANAAFLYRRRRSIRPVATWLVIGLWALTSGLLTSIGRADYFPDPNPRHPLLDRYVLPSTYLWFAFIALSVMALRYVSRHRHDHTGRLLSFINVGVLVALVGLFGWTTLWSYQLPPFVTEFELACMQRFPVTRNIGCMTRGLLDTLDRQELLFDLNGLAIHQLAGFRDIEPQYTAITRLDELNRDRSREHDGARFSFYQFNETTIRAVFQQPAPSVSVFTVPVPQTDQPVIFFSAVYVEQPEATSGPAPDGVVFRIGLRDAAGNEVLLLERPYNPLDEADPATILLPLDSYRGQTVELFLQTDARENPNADWALWVDPSIMVRPE